MTKLHNYDIDTKRGFDCLDHSGKVVKHFATYEEAESFRKSKIGLTTRFWVKVAQ